MTLPILGRPPSSPCQSGRMLSGFRSKKKKKKKKKREVDQYKLLE
jgi:hypothetical protein